MESVLIVVHLLIVVALCGVVLLQRSEGGGLGLGGGGGSPSSFMSGRGQANALTRATAILGTAFFITSLILAVLASKGSAPRSVIDGVAPPASTAPGAPAPAAPGGGILDQLQQMQRNAPPAPPTAN